MVVVFLGLPGKATFGSCFAAEQWKAGLMVELVGVSCSAIASLGSSIQWSSNAASLDLVSLCVGVLADDSREITMFAKHGG